MNVPGPMAGVLPADTQEAKQPVWSIERLIAFVVAPLITAGTGWLSLTIATNFPGHPEVPPEALYGFAVVMMGAVATFFHKWLNERSKQLIADKGGLASVGPVLGEVHKLESGTIGQGLIHTTLQELEGLAQSAAQHALAGMPQVTRVEAPPPIADAAGDPAPATAVADPGAPAAV